MQKLLLVLSICIAPLNAMEPLSENFSTRSFEKQKTEQSLSAEPLSKASTFILQESRFPIAAAEKEPVCVYDSCQDLDPWSQYYREHPQICWDINAQGAKVYDAPQLYPGFYRRPLVGSTWVLGWREKSNSKLMILYEKNSTKGIILNFEKYLAEIKDSTGAEQWEAPYAYMLDDGHIFFRATKSLYICSLAALKEGKEGLFKKPWYIKPHGYYHSHDACQRMGKDLVLLGSDQNSLEVVRRGKDACSLVVARTFKNNIFMVQASAVRGIAAVLFHGAKELKLYDADLEAIACIPFNEKHGIETESFELSPSGNYVAYPVWSDKDRCHRVIIVGCSDLKNSQEHIVIHNPCYRMLWSSQGLFFDETSLGTGKKVLFKNEQ